MIKGMLIAILIGPPIVAAIILIVQVRSWALMKQLSHVNLFWNFIFYSVIDLESLLVVIFTALWFMFLLSL